MIELTEEQKKYYEKKREWMTQEERLEYIETRRNGIEGWTKKLQVSSPAGTDQPYDGWTAYDDVVSSISLVSNMWVKQMVFEFAGDSHPGHAHTFDHQTLLANGSVEVNVNGEKTIFKAPNIIYIKAGLKHGLIALEDKTVVYCVHPLRGGDQVGDIIDPASIPNGVMPLIESMPKKLIPTDQL
jgi:quercetin dioxygenase-like cupin family protein